MMIKIPMKNLENKNHKVISVNEVIKQMKNI